MKQAYIYARVSTEEQAENGKSIETQLRLCRKWAQDNDHSIIREFIDEGKSETNLYGRPALKDLMAHCENGQAVDAIIVQDTDRLARNTYDHLTIKTLLKKHGVKVVSVSQPMIDDSPEGNLVDTLIAGVNAFQSQITGRKTSKVMEEKAKLGWWPGGAPMLGYKLAPNPTPTSTLDKSITVINQDTSPWIKKAFEMYATGNCNLKEIAEFLNSKGVKSTYGNKVHVSTTAKMLASKFYIGKFTWHDKEYDGKHELFISPELFSKVQLVLAAHNQNATRKRKHNFLLRGFAFCADCGGQFWAEHHVKENGLTYDQYFCSKCKRGSYVDKDKLEKRAEKIFQRIEISKEYSQGVKERAKQMLEEDRASTDSERRRLGLEKSKTEKAIKETEDSRFIYHTLNDESFQRVNSRYEAQLKSVEKALAQVGQDHSQNVERLNRLLQLAENIGVAYVKANDIIKRNYLGLFIKKFKISKGRIVSFELADNIKPLIEEGSVRVRTPRLPRVDSDHEPSP